MIGETKSGSDGRDGLAEGNLRVSVFGGLTLQLGNSDTVAMSSRRAGLLLARLIVRSGKKVDRDELAESIWPNADRSSAKSSLRQAVFGLKQVLEPLGCSAFDADDQSCWLDSDQVKSDYEVFKRGLASEDFQAWKEAIDAYCGPFLGRDDDVWAANERYVLEAEYRQLLFRIVRHFGQQGFVKEAIEYALLASRNDPLDERARFSLIRLYLRDREFSLAKQEYSDLENRLSQELGTQPSIPFARLTAKAGSVEDIGESNPATAPQRLESDSPSTPGRSRMLLVACLAVAAMSLAFLAFSKSGHKRSYEELHAEFVQLSKALPTDQNRERQSAVLALIAEDAYSAIYGPDEQAWRGRLSPDMKEIERVEAWCLTHNVERAIQIGGALERYSLLAGNWQAWGQQLNRALDASSEKPSKERSRAIVAVAFANGMDSPVMARRLASAVDYYHSRKETWGEAQTTRAQGFIAASNYRFGEAHDRYKTALSLFRQAGSNSGEAITQLCIAVTAGDPRESPAQAEIRQFENIIASFDKFSLVRNDWGIEFSGSILLEKALKSSANRQTIPYLNQCRIRLAKLADYEEVCGNSAASSESHLNSVRIALRCSDKQALVQSLAETVSSSFASRLSAKELFMLGVAGRQLEKGGGTNLVTEETLSELKSKMQNVLGADGAEKVANDADKVSPYEAISSVFRQKF